MGRKRVLSDEQIAAISQQMKENNWTLKETVEKNTVMTTGLSIVTLSNSLKRINKTIQNETSN